MAQLKGALVVGAILASALVAVLCVAVCSPRQADAESPGVRWVELSLDQALAKAKQEKTRVFVAFTATWCPSCKQLDEEVFSTALGGEITSKLIPLRLDFDEEANRAQVERYVVLGLPTVVVLDPEGMQMGRVMGYDGRDDWTSKARAAIASDDPIPALRAALAGQRENLSATVRLGAALLVRGEAVEGETLLERALWMTPREGTSDAEAAAEALFVLGRYHQRVKRDPATARHYWRELAAQYPRSEWAAGAWWWYAKALAELDRHEVGLEALRSRARAEPENVEALVEWGQFIVRYKLVADRAAAKASVDKRLTSKVTDEQRRDLESLAKELVSPATPGQ